MPCAAVTGGSSTAADGSARSPSPPWDRSARVATYQLGLVRHLPGPPGRLFDADRVDASGEAYRFLKTPDAAIGLVSYAATLVMAGMRADRHPATQPLLSLAFGAKVLADAAGGVFLTVEQATKHRRFCSWCLAAAACSVATVPQVVPEVRAAWRGLRTR